jgi:hypothetical protein
MCSDNAIGADNQQERLNAYTGIDVRKLICVAVQLWLPRKHQGDPGQCIGVGNSESSETICRTPSNEMAKIWSDLHGDMQSQAEMTWPPSNVRE